MRDVLRLLTVVFMVYLSLEQGMAPFLFDKVVLRHVHYRKLEVVFE